MKRHFATLRRFTGSIQKDQPAVLHLSCEDCDHRFKALTQQQRLYWDISVPNCFEFGRCGETAGIFEGYCVNYQHTEMVDNNGSLQKQTKT